MRTVYYLGFYDIEKNKCENRNIFLAATNKMSYIIKAVENSGYYVEVISASQTLSKEKCPAKSVDIGEKSKLHLFKSLPWGNGVRRVMSRRYSLNQVYNFLINNLTSDDVLIVYHSMAYISLLKKAKKKIGFKFIIEIEEIYSDVTGIESNRKKEMNFFKLADSYILPTVLLDEHINHDKKPMTLIHGAYKVEPKRKENIFENDENNKQIHCVYAGTFDPRKGGVTAAVKAAMFLPSNYHLHILGFGNKTDTKSIKSLIDEISKKSKANVTYDGLLSGEDYIRFIQSCDIGLSTQNPKAAFNSTSFPSKILSYMANGLRVVSIRIPAIETSAVGKYMYYYEEQQPKEIAKAIMSVNMNDDYNGRKIISNLDTEFYKNIAKLLEH